MSPTPYLTTKDLIKLLQVDKEQLVSLIKNENLPFIRLENEVRFKLKDFAKWIEAHTRTPKEDPEGLSLIEGGENKSDDSSQEEAEAAPEFRSSEYFHIEEEEDELYLTIYTDEIPSEIRDYLTSILTELKVMENPSKTIDKALDEPDEPVSAGPLPPTMKDRISFLVSPDRMMAHMFIPTKFSGKSESVDAVRIIKELKKNQIVYGVMPVMIQNANNREIRGKVLPIARAKPPVHGSDPQIVYQFETDKTFKPRQLEDLETNVEKLSGVTLVRKEQQLAELILAGDAEDGVDVSGKKVKYKTGTGALLKGGPNTYFSQDRLRLHASHDGVAYWKGSSISVDATLFFSSVGYDTGNVDFDGRVIIYGNVARGFTVSGKNKVLVKGLSEAKMLLSTNSSVSIDQGVRGAGESKIVAKNNIYAPFVEVCDLQAGKNIEIENSLVRCNVSAGKSIVMKNPKSRIANSVLMAGQSITVYNIGGGRADTSELKIEQPADDRSGSERLHLEKQIEDTMAEIKNTKLRVQRLSAQRSVGEKKERDRLEKIHVQLKNEQKALETFLKWTEQSEEICIKVLEKVNPGVVITIEDATMTVSKQLEKQIFRYKKGKIVQSDIKE